MLDYGRPDEFPFHALVANPAGQAVPADFLNALHARPFEEHVGAEYSMGELVMWVDFPTLDENAGESFEPGDE